MADIIQFRRDTLERWSEFNPTLAEGEIGFVLGSSNRYKVGDGVHAWNDLPLKGFNGNIVDLFTNNEDEGYDSVISQGGLSTIFKYIVSNGSHIDISSSWTSLDEFNTISKCGFYVLMRGKTPCYHMMVTADSMAHGVCQWIFGNLSIDDDGQIRGGHWDGRAHILFRYIGRGQSTWSNWKYLQNDFISNDGETNQQIPDTAYAPSLNYFKKVVDEIQTAITTNTENIAEVRDEMITNISVDGDSEGVNITVENTLIQAGISMKIPNADVRSNKAGVVTGTEINALYEIDLAAADVTNIGFEKDAEKNKITLTGIGQLGDYQSSEIELTPATSELAGLMSAEDKRKISSLLAKDATHDTKITKLEERVLNYIYPKLYQLNEGAGALPFDGMYSGSASVLDGRKTVAEDGHTYKVVFALGKFLLLEINQDGEDAGLYEAWDKIISGRGSSEDYKRKDCLYYVYTEGEGSYYYYVDADGEISEQSGTYLLRKLIDETKAKIASVESTANSAQATATAAQTKNTEQDARLDALENPPADYAEMIIEATETRHYKLFYDVRCISWLEIDGEEIELPVITENRAAQYYATLSQGRHVVRFRPKEGNMSDGTPWKERQGLLGWCDDNCVTEITLPEGWDVINIKMFEGAASLRRVNLPSTIREVRYGAFGNCAALEEIVLPPSVETIQAFIVHDCPALKRIVLGGRDIAATGTLAQSCAALECVEFRAGGTVKFSGTANTFVNLPQLARFIVRGNLPTFECSQPFTSSGYVGSSVEADKRWLFTSDGERPYETKWSSDLMRLCNFTVKKLFSYTLN